MSLLDDLVPDLERLAALLAQGGRQPFLERPIVLPDPRWFPDRWTSDLESARVLAGRMLAYAGLENLTAECLPFDWRHGDPLEWRARQVFDRLKAVRAPTSAWFQEIRDGNAIFVIDDDGLDRQELPGMLAHEVARAWRRFHRLETDDRTAEGLLTDLTMIVLGFGVLAATTGYSYEIDSTTLTGPQTVRRRVETEMVGTAALIAVQCVVREEDPERIRRFLDSTECAAFDAICSEADPHALRELLGLVDTAWEPAPEDPPPVVIRPGRVQNAVRACSERIVQELGDEGGFLSTPIPADFFPMASRHRTVGAWFRPHVGGGGGRWLTLVEDPEWSSQLLILECLDRGESRTLAIALLPEEVLGGESKLALAVAPFFERCDLDLVLAGELPSIVKRRARAVLGKERLGKLMTKAIARLAPGAANADLSRLIAFAGRARARLLDEAREPSPSGPPPEDQSRMLELWWEHSSSPHFARDEGATWEEVQPEIPDPALPGRDPGP